MPVMHLVRYSPISGSPKVPTGFRIRPFCASDAARVAVLATSQQAVPVGPRPAAAGLGAELSGRPDREIAAWVALCDSNNDDVVVGLATLVTSKGKVSRRRSIAWLLVHPSTRRQGLGRALVETIFNEAWCRDQPEIWIECHSAWHGAIAFWRSIGFRSREFGPTSSTA